MDAKNREIPKFIEKELSHCPQELRSLVSCNPTDENLSLLQNLCGVPKEILAEIRKLRDFPPTHPPRDAVEKYLGYFARMIGSTEYNPKLMNRVIELTLDIVLYSGGIEHQLPGIRESIGFGLRLARTERGWTQQEAVEAHTLSLYHLRSLELGRFERSDLTRFQAYCLSLFPDSEHVCYDALEILKGRDNRELHQQLSSSYHIGNLQQFGAVIEEFYSDEP